LALRGSVVSHSGAGSVREVDFLSVLFSADAWLRGHRLWEQHSISTAVALGTVCHHCPLPSSINHPAIWNSPLFCVAHHLEVKTFLS